MLEGFIGGLAVAWILSVFNVDAMLITAIKEIFSITISVSTYYILFGIIGLIGGAFHK